MRKFNFFVLLCLMGSGGDLVHAQGVGSLNAGHLGTKTPYEPLARSFTAMPAGYKPVFIDYVGRHGARFLTKAGADVEVANALDKAGTLDGVSDIGKRIRWAAAGLLREAGNGGYENITLLGQEEQAAIGERMRGAFGTVFRGRGVEVVTTYKARTQQSAEAFLKGLDRGAALEPKKFSRAPDSLDTVLRFYDLSAGYQRYKKGALLKQCEDSLARDPRTLSMANAVCGRVFSAGYLSKLNASERIAFAESLYDLYAISFSMKGEVREEGVSAALGAAFSTRDLEWLDFTNGASDWLEKGPGFDSLGIQVKIAAPLLLDFVETMDRAVSGSGLRARAGGLGQGLKVGAGGGAGKGMGSDTGSTSGANPDAVLRFTHAEAISPVAALMGIQGASEPARSVFEYRSSGWRAEQIIPLSANIQWILYARKGGDWLVKALLNEKEVRFSGVPGSGPYYRWKDLRKHFLRRLESIGVRPGMDMRRWLAELK